MNSTLKSPVLATFTMACFMSAAPFCAAQQKVEKRASSGISVSNRNGDVSVIWKGKVVFTGKATGQISAKSANENGTEFAAAFDGDKVLWENVPGAAENLKNR